MLKSEGLVWMDIFSNKLKHYNLSRWTGMNLEECVLNYLTLKVVVRNTFWYKSRRYLTRQLKKRFPTWFTIVRNPTLEFYTYIIFATYEFKITFEPFPTYLNCRNWKGFLSKCTWIHKKVNEFFSLKMNINQVIG